MLVIARPDAVNTRALIAIVASLLLAACSGGSGCYTAHGHPAGECDPPPPPPATYSVRGYVGGLTGSGLTLSYNGGTPVAVTRNGAVTLAVNLPNGTQYSVAVANQPTNPAQTCT